MASLRDLAKRLENLADEVEAAPSKVAAELSYRIVEILTVRTPVDTSKALSNWLTSLSDPILIDMDAYYEGIYGSTASSSRAATLSHTETILAGKQPGEAIFIANSAPYIRELNEGSSKQAPAGFVEASLLAARAELPAIIKRVIKNGR